jgi:hypothetical protein
MVGDRYFLAVLCSECGAKHLDVYYAPTCDMNIFNCVCGNVIDLGVYSGITYEDASNAAEIETVIRKTE